MDFIVLVKQVPDITHIPEEAWDKEKGTLRRGMLDNVLNPLDLHALTLAYRMEEQAADPGSRIVALTMGPPQAREVLVDALSRGADVAVLLSDRAFSGADTVATAYSLALGIRRIEEEILGRREYVVVSGMQSVDGDTAQVPGQIAEELGIEHIAYASSFTFEPGLVVRRIGQHGVEAVAPKRYPVLVTATACTEPLYRSFHRGRAAREVPIHEWDAKAVGADVRRTGLKGSRTQVVHIFPPSEARARQCVFHERVGDLLQAIEQRYAAAPKEAAPSAGPPYQLGDRTPAHRGEVWVYAEHEAGQIAPVTLELLGKARELAAALREPVGAVLVGSGVEGLARTLIAHGADRVHVAEHPHLEHFLPIPYKKAICDLVSKHHPQILLFGATPLGRELAPRVAYRSGAGLTADCTRLEIGDLEKAGKTSVAVLLQTRPALGGNIMATIVTKDSPIQMATVRPGVLRALPPDPGRTGDVLCTRAEIDEEDLRTTVLSRESFASKTGIADADIVVSGGRGMGSKAAFDRLLYPLAAALGGLFPGRVEVGATRTAVEEGFTDHDHQVGQTGQTVRPALYVAAGISGAVQHVSGMMGSRVVVAIDRDPHARIFDQADLGMVGDVEVILPALTEAISQRKRQA